MQVQVVSLHLVLAFETLCALEGICIRLKLWDLKCAGRMYFYIHFWPSDKWGHISHKKNFPCLKFVVLNDSTNLLMIMLFNFSMLAVRVSLPHRISPRIRLCFVFSPFQRLSSCSPFR